jgi:hypothetical protein
MPKVEIEKRDVFCKAKKKWKLVGWQVGGIRIIFDPEGNQQVSFEKGLSRELPTIKPRCWHFLKG